MRSQFRGICAVLAITLLSQLAACGTLFYPDRRGQIDGKIDPAIAVLNAIGLLFYIVPGLIAFAIDFTTGAIYLPEGTYSVAPERLQVAPEQLKNAIGSDGRIDNHRLKAIIEHETGRQLPLLHPNLREQHGSVEQLATLGLRSAG